LSVFSAATPYEPIYLISIIGITVKASISALLAVFTDPLPPRSANHHFDFAAAALRADEPLVPIRNSHLGGVAHRLLGRVRLGLMPAGFAPHDQADAGRR